MKYYYSLKYLLIIINMFSLPVSTQRTIYNKPCACGEPAAWQSKQCPSCLRKNNPKSSTTTVYTAPTSPNTNVYQRQQPPNIFGREYIAVPSGIFQQNYNAVPRNYIAVPSNVIYVHVPTPNISTRYY